MDTNKIRIGVFGDQASGKTTLLSSYFGLQQGYNFEKEKGYRLVAADVSDGRKLLQNYYKMQEGDFPQGTVSRAHPYSFDFKISELSQPALRIEWIDYPGGWWSNEPELAEEKENKRNCIRQLLDADLCVLCVDGAKYIQTASRKAYLRVLFDHFRNEVLRWHDFARENGQPVEVANKEWIIALTKADLVFEKDTTYNAERFAKELIANYNDYQEGLSKAVHGIAANVEYSPGRDGFGSRYMLLSAARGEGTRVTSTEQTIGLDLIAPAALRTFLERMARSMQSSAERPELSIWERLILFASQVARNKDVEKAVGKTNQGLLFVARLLLNLASQNTQNHIKIFQEKRKDAVREGKALDALVSAFGEQLTSEHAKLAYFITQF